MPRHKENRDRHRSAAGPGRRNFPGRQLGDACTAPAYLGQQLFGPAFAFVSAGVFRKRSGMDWPGALPRAAHEPVGCSSVDLDLRPRLTCRLEQRWCPYRQDDIFPPRPFPASGICLLFRRGNSLAAVVGQFDLPRVKLSRIETVFAASRFSACKGQQAVARTERETRPDLTNGTGQLLQRSDPARNCASRTRRGHHALGASTASATVQPRTLPTSTAASTNSAPIWRTASLAAEHAVRCRASTSSRRWSIRSSRIGPSALQVDQRLGIELGA